MQTSPSNVVICGAGVIGSAIAYYLSLRGVAVTIVERYDVACAASGKAGGFLAMDWCDGSPLGTLARKSFQLHAELAETLGADYGYRRMTTLAVTPLTMACGSGEAYPMSSPGWTRMGFRLGCWERHRRRPRFIRNSSPRHCYRPR